MKNSLNRFAALVTVAFILTAVIPSATGYDRNHGSLCGTGQTLCNK